MPYPPGADPPGAGRRRPGPADPPDGRDPALLGDHRGRGAAPAGTHHPRADRRGAPAQHPVGTHARRGGRSPAPPGCLRAPAQQSQAPTTCPPIPRSASPWSASSPRSWSARQLFGYIWIIASDQPLTRLDYPGDRARRGGGGADPQPPGSHLRKRAAPQDADSSKVCATRTPPPRWTACRKPPGSSGLQYGYTLLVIDAGSPDRQSLRQLANLVEAHMQPEGCWATAIERGRHLAVVLVATLETKHCARLPGALPGCRRKRASRSGWGSAPLPAGGSAAPAATSKPWMP